MALERPSVTDHSGTALSGPFFRQRAVVGGDFRGLPEGRPEEDRSPLVDQLEGCSQAR